MSQKIFLKSAQTANQAAKNSFFQLYASQMKTLWKFSRPHTIIGTSLSVLGLHTIAVANSSVDFSITQIIQLVVSWIACLCGNIYIVGLNQLEDVEIDRINKPDLPIAAGQFSRRQAQIIVIVTGILALMLAWLSGPFLLLMVGVSLTIGTVYSLPPIRLKRFPVWAALCIFSVRGVVVNLGLFLHFNQKLSNTNIILITPEVWALTLFVLVFTLAIAIFKDMPDLEGDRQYNITTFTIKMGTLAVFKLALSVLTVCYVGMIIGGGIYLPVVNRIFLIISHLIPLTLIWWQSRKIDLHSKSSITGYYQFIWKLFFLEYLIFPIACLLP